MNKKIFLLSISLCFALFAFATIPTGYYNSANGKKGEALRQALHEIIDGHTSISYSALGDYYALTDCDATGHIIDMYSTCSFTIDDARSSQTAVCQGWNKEHSVPSSWFKKGTPMYSDLFHVIPTDARVNNFRGNMPYGETSSTAYIANDSHSLGHIGSSSFSGYSGTVFEPDDEYKGDFARNYLYMVTRYTTTNFTQSTGAEAVFTYSGGQSGLTTYAINLFMKWHRQDPVSQKEIDRNNAVYGIQHNRNPFIDYPYLAEYIWGTKQNASVNMTTEVISSSDERYTPGVSDGSLTSLTPQIITSTSQLSFGSLLNGNSRNQNLTFSGSQLTNNILLTISGTNAQYFSVSPKSITAANANGNNLVTVTYSPLSEGSHTATLTLSSTSADDVVITLKGTCQQACTIQWLVNGQEYTEGEPDTEVALGATPTALPTPPASCSETSEQFAGWTATPISSSTNDIPADLFSAAEDAPVINNATTFYAVFAHIEEIEGSAPISDTYTFADHYTSNADATTAQLANATISFDKANASTAAKYYDTSLGVRAYGGSQIIVTGNNLQEIQFEFSTVGKDHTNEITANVGAFSTDTWTGLSNKVIFTIGGTSKFRAIAAITVTSQEQATDYQYSYFITQCSSTTDIEEQAISTQQYQKFLINGHLFIRIGEHLYNSNGQIIK